MSFLEWRRFNFFDLKNNVDFGNIEKALGCTSVTATSSGHGTLVICDSEGVIHLVNRNFQITTFQGYLVNVSLAEQLRSVPLLVTIGEDEIGINPVLKVWDLDKSDRQGNPICLRTLRPVPNNKAVPVSALCVADSVNMMAVGFSNGCILLYRGNITRDRGIKQKILRDEDEPVTGLAFKTSAKHTHLFVATSSSILQYNVSVKDKEFVMQLDSAGCAARCSVLADTIQDSPFMTARDDAIYCYTVDGRGPCYAIEGHKVFLQWFRTYLVIVAEDTKSSVQSPITVSSTNTEDTVKDDNNEYLITVLDIQNKFIVYSTSLRDVIAIMPEWGSFYILTKDYKLHHLQEKNLQSKLALLFKKNLYDISIRIAKSQQYDADSLVDIFRQYGDHLYTKGDNNGAIEQYIKTIGKLEPSYVIRKYLDSQFIDNLIKYLSALHKEGLATGDHTTLLLNCYTKLNNVNKLKEFILTKDREIDFDLNIAIAVCRQSSSEDALLLAEKHNLHLWYIKILLQDFQDYSNALQYIAKLEFEQAREMICEFGDVLIQNSPVETTQLLKKLCTGYYPSDTLLLDTVNKTEVNQVNPQDVMHLFLNNSEHMIDFLEHLTNYSSKWDVCVYNTLIEHYLHLWTNLNDRNTVRVQYEQKLMNLLQSSDACYDKNQALILCTKHLFNPGILYLLEENKLYYQILWHHLKRGNYAGVAACCRRFGYQEPSLWIKALWAAAQDDKFPSSVLSEILTVIEKEKLLSPLQVVEILSKYSSLNIGSIRSYLLSILRSENRIIEEEKILIEKYKVDTENIKDRVNKIRNSPVLFQGSRCSACNNHLELPSIHFLCQHSYHQHCHQSIAEDENECPVCRPNNKKILSVIKSQEQNRDIHETFHSQLERAEDGFSLISDYFGRSVFSSAALSLAATDKIKQALKIMKYANLNQNNTREIGNAIDIPKINYAAEVQETKLNGLATLEANITPSSNSSYEIQNLSNIVENKLPQNIKNPFEDEYSGKNPFEGEHDTDDSEDNESYDNSLNPFLS